MLVKTFGVRVAVVALLAVVPTAAAWGQQVPPPGQPARPEAQPAVSDTELAAWIILDNQGEIQLAQLALQQSARPDVRQFAQLMIRDRTELVQALQQRLGVPAQPQNGAPAALPPELLQQYPLLGLYAELGQRVLQSTTQMLQGRTGLHFDRTFMHLQVVLHMRQLDTLILFAQRGSPELRPLLEQHSFTMMQRLQFAQNILAQLEGVAPPAGAQPAAPQPAPAAPAANPGNPGRRQNSPAQGAYRNR